MMNLFHNSTSFHTKLSYSVNESLSEGAVHEGEAWAIEQKHETKRLRDPKETHYESWKAVLLTFSA